MACESNLAEELRRDVEKAERAAHHDAAAELDSGGHREREVEVARNVGQRSEHARDPRDRDRQPGALGAGDVRTGEGRHDDEAGDARQDQRKAQRLGEDEAFEHQRTTCSIATKLARA